MTTLEGRKNLYICDDCGHGVVTQDLDAGVTPFMIACKNCRVGMASSMFYPERVLDNKNPAFVWRKPPAVQVLSEWEQSHIKKGGLLLYPNPASSIQKIAGRVLPAPLPQGEGE